jgi:hypothetical protein
MRLSIRSKLYVFSAVAMLALAAMGALGLAAGYLADVQLHRLRHDHGLALARLSQGEATMRASPPAWPMLTALTSNPPELFAEPTLQAPWQAWQHAVASQNPAAMQQHWATLAHQTRALIDREQSEQDQLRHQLFQLILWGGAALSIGLLALARWIIRTIVRPLRTLEATASQTASDLDLTRRCQLRGHDDEVAHSIQAFNALLDAIGDSFRLAEDDFITYKESDDVKRIDITTKTTSGIAKLYFTVPSNIYLTYIPYLNITKNTVGDRSSDMLITVEDEYAGYMVYDNLGLTGIYEKAGDAINRATQIAGIVVSKDGEIVYRQSEMQAYNTIASSIYHQSSGSVDASLWDCVYMTLIYEGVTDLTYEDMKASGTDPVQVLTELGKYPGADISGISLDLVFGYISNGIPVISRINDGRYVMVVSYNSEAVRYYDPVLDTEVRVSRKEYEAAMSQGNNELYSYVQE